ncbi:phosphoribosyltransferase [Pyrolobus fumarii 1A]|uniref:Phosphoribosyltransferase n=1 Tax=Pyrolobus fumarii (strain DSM 11204 / 1A) TaxID=694429 RepID=G0ECL7_PYRF1|nr:phosphoribosyltransferase family protein [Pyrolobus fumarii]AEM39587.1 phosphoribosyltransferase [Pyrolobus fumarii 1A]
MSALSKYDAIRFRLQVVSLLRLLKKIYSYRELSAMTGIPESVLCRYVRGQTIPSLEQAHEIKRRLEENTDIRKIVASRVEHLLEGYVDLTQVIGDPSLLRLMAYYVTMKLAGKRVTKVLVPETNGIPFATMIADVLEVPLVIAKRNKDNPYEEYVEANVVEPSIRSTITYYIPRRLISRRDSVLIVDDLIQSGRTIRALAASIEKLGAKPVATAAIVAVGEPRVSIPQPLIVLLHLSEPSRLARV